VKQVIKRIISDFHARPLPAFKPRHLEVPLNLGKIITIIGPRRAGKTWYFFQLISRLEQAGIKRQQILYLNFEDERLDFEGTSYDDILDAYLELYVDQELNNVYLFFDEIQEINNWEKFIRRLYDTVTRNIFLTGSNARMLSKEIATSLRGRSLSFEIMPLSFMEYLEFKGIDYHDRYSTRNRARIQNSFEEYLIWGGFPELVDIDTRFKPDILQEYFNVMLYRDLTERYSIRDVSILKYLIKRLIASFTKEFSVNKLYNDLKSRGLSIGKNSIYRITEQIFSVFLMTYIEKYDPSVVKREMSNRKIYLYDNGFASAINYIFSEDRGKLLENLVFSYLRSRTEEIFFLKNGWECDFVAFFKNKRPLLVQVTDHLTKDNVARELKGISRAQKRIKDARAIILTSEKKAQIDNMPDGIEVFHVMDWLMNVEGNRGRP